MGFLTASLNPGASGPGLIQPLKGRTVTVKRVLPVRGLVRTLTLLTGDQGWLVTTAARPGLGRPFPRASSPWFARLLMTVIGFLTAFLSGVSPSLRVTVTLLLLLDPLVSGSPRRAVRMSAEGSSGLSPGK